MPDDRYNNWVKVTFCGSCGALAKATKANPDGLSRCRMCETYIELATERIEGLFHPADAQVMKRFI